MLRCIIVDDQITIVQSLKNYIRKIPFLELTGTFSESRDALLHLKKDPVDLVFLDIKKPARGGNNPILTFQRHAMVILISVNHKFAIEGFEHNVVDFMLKPISYVRFYKAVEKAYHTKFPPEQTRTETKSAALKGGYVFIKESTRLIRVELDEIYYVMGLKNYVSIFTKSHRLVTLQTMKQMEDMLPAHRFSRVHRSYLVALDKIYSVEKQQIHLKDKIIPIGNIYLSLFMKKLTAIGNQ